MFTNSIFKVATNLLYGLKRFYKASNAKAYLVFFCAFIFAIITYCTFSTDSFELKSTKTGFYLIYIDAILVLAILYIVIKKFSNLYYAQKYGLSGSRFHVKLVSLFSLLTIIPTVMMSIFAIVFFHGGMDSWFTQKNKTVLNESLSVAQAYLAEHRELMKDDAVAVAKMLETKLPILPDDFNLRSKFLKSMLKLRGLSDGILVDNNRNVLARTEFSFALEFQRITPEILADVLEKEVVLINTNDKKHIFAIAALDFQEQLFLLVKKPIDDKVINHVEKTKEAVQEYFAVQSERKSLELGFALLFLLTAVLLVFSAIGTAVNMASRIVTPISNLINAAEKIRDGNLETRVLIKTSYDELNILNKTFNEMTERLQEQHRDLIKVNKDLDSRMQFIENVLYSISSGVLGLTKSLKIYIANEPVKHLLNISDNFDISKSIPGIVPLFDKARENSNKVIEDNITVKTIGGELILLVRIIYDPIKLNGFVVTIDDLTEISLAQRKAAWSDVARSVAHEIKNPLTPIKLAAERIEKKYIDCLDSEKDKTVFTNLISTIVKHSDNIKRLVDEFSMFARLPNPQTCLNDIVLICESAILFAQTTYSDVKFIFESDVKNLLIHCDENLIRQVLNNLLKNSVNAIKYSNNKMQNNSLPYVKLTISCIESGFVSLVVSDNGPGFSDEYKRKILQPYFSLTPNGTGLGLVISNKIITDHGGTMNLTNGENGGAIVSVRLPC